MSGLGGDCPIDGQATVLIKTYHVGNDNKLSKFTQNSILLHGHIISL